MSLLPITSHELSSLTQALDAHPRSHGYYLLKVVAFDPPPDDARDEALLEDLFRHLDDRPWPRPVGSPAEGAWSDYRVDGDEARAEVVVALIGGSDVGHAQDTIDGRLAETIWATFERQFGPDRDYYMHMGFGNPDYVYQRGVVIVDGTRAGILYVVEGD